MSNEELKRDFESAQIKHVHFKSKLRSFLFGNKGEEGPLRDPEKCGFGLWVAERMRGAGPYAHLREARQLDREHVHMHEEANRLMDLYLAGRADEAIEGFGPVQEVADRMVGLLKTMEEKMRTGAIA